MDGADIRTLVPLAQGFFHIFCVFSCRAYLRVGKVVSSLEARRFIEHFPDFDHVSSRQMQCTVIDLWILGFSLFQPICVVYCFPVFSFLKSCMAIVKNFFTFKLFLSFTKSYSFSKGIQKQLTFYSSLRLLREMRMVRKA